MLLEEDGVGGDRLAAPRQFTKYRRLQIAVVGQRDRAWDRRRGHHEQMRCDALGRLGAQPIPLFDSEPMLFVDDDHAEAVELNGVL
jgi:hypothetical protein